MYLNPATIFTFALLLLTSGIVKIQKPQTKQAKLPDFDWKDDPSTPGKRIAVVDENDFIKWLKENPYFVQANFHNIEHLLQVVSNEIGITELAAFKMFTSYWLNTYFPGDNYRPSK